MAVAPPPTAPPTPRMRREAQTVRTMISMYCRSLHGKGPGPCHECATLQTYIDVRLARCPFSPDKPTCANCTIHCYRSDMRERIREVMRWAGPRMAWRHPVMALMHVLEGRATGSPASRGTASRAPAPSRTPPR